MSTAPRLLVFGGTGFIERLRLGEWPTFPAGMLSDTYGLGTGALSLGVGVRDDNPFIIYRELQQHRDRTYPYWLLLDPGDGPWQRFKWNGASIVAALARTALWVRLRQEPESVDANEVRDTIGALRQAVDSPPLQVDSFAGFVVGAATQESGIALCSPAVCTNGRADSADDLARLVEYLAPAFRIAKGWLISGAAAHGKELGCADRK